MNELDGEVARYVARGYQLVSRNEREAILAYHPAPGAFLWRWLWLGPFILLFWPRWRAIRITLDPRGGITEETVPMQQATRANAAEDRAADWGARWRETDWRILAAAAVVWILVVLVATWK